MELLPSTVVMRIKASMDELMKKKISAVQAPADKEITEHSLLRLLEEQSETIDFTIRADFIPTCINAHDTMFPDMAQGLGTGGDTSLRASMKDARRRHVQSFVDYMYSSGADDKYDASIARIQKLMNHMTRCANALSKALFSQKTAFVGFLSQAEDLAHILQDIKVFPTAVSDYHKCWVSVNLIYRAAAESLCIQNSSAPMALMMTQFFPPLLEKLQLRKLLVLDHKAHLRRLRKASSTVTKTKFQNKVDISDAAIKEISDDIDARLAAIEEDQFDER